MLFWYRVIIEPVSLWQVLKFNDKWLHRYYYVVIYFLLPSRFREHGDGSAIHFEGNSSGVVAVSHHGCTLHPRWNTASVFRLVISVVIFRCVLASLYEGLSVRRSVRPSVGPSVGRSVGRSRFRQKRENRWFWSQIMMSHAISSSYNHLIIMRTHRWPYGPCLFVHLIIFFVIWFFRGGGGVRPSVRPLVDRSVGHAFVKNRENLWTMDDVMDASKQGP